MAKKISKNNPTKKTPNKNQTKKNKKNNKKINKKTSNIKINKTLFDSKLITNINQIELIKTGIKNYDKTKELELKLLFRASKDGDNNKSYHDLCD